MHVLVIRNNSNPQATEASLLLGAYLGMQGIESSLVDSRDLVGPAEIGEVRRVDEHAFINIIKTDVFAGRFHHRPTD